MIKSSTVFAGLIAGAHAFWRMECPSRVALARMDPIVDPGVPSPHVHSIHGSSGFDLFGEFSSLMAGDCTSCRVTQDKSVYWHPSLYFQDADTGEFELVNQVGGMLAYYLLNGDNITAFPPGFRMLAGETTRRTYTAGDPNKPDPEKSLWALNGETDQKTLAQRALGFNCLNYAKDPEATLYRHFLPEKSYLDANCKDGVRFEMMFPSCWDGENKDSLNHQDHVAYPDLVITGTCPKGYDVRTPSLLYETIWATNSYADRNGHFVLSNGDTTGYGYHADFLTGWEPEFLQSAVETCTNPSGRIEDCPLFDVVSEDISKKCELEVPSILAKEDCEGPFSSLPGGVPIRDSDGSLEGGILPAPIDITHPPMPTLTYLPGQPPKDPASPVPGEVFHESSANVYPAPAPTTLSSIPAPPPPPAPSPIDESIANNAPVVEQPAVPAPPPTTTAAPEFAPIEENSDIFSTQYVTNGNVVSKILWAEEMVTVTEILDSTTTLVVPAAPSNPGQRKRRAAHLHGHGHRHI